MVCLNGAAGVSPFPPPIYIGGWGFMGMKTPGNPHEWGTLGIYGDWGLTGWRCITACLLGTKLTRWNHD